MESLDMFAHSKLAQLEAGSLRRQLQQTDRGPCAEASRQGRRLLSFCCNDYLNLTHHPAVKLAARDALERWGTGSGASRLVTGNHSLLIRLEERLARLRGTEDCVVFGSGYLANLGIVPALVGPQDVILADELCHACLLAGAGLSGAATRLFRHNDMRNLAELLQNERPRYRFCLILTDGVFSMDGDLAPLPEMNALATAHDAWLMSDDAHGIGVIGAGRGSTHAHGPAVRIPLQMGTLSKAIGSYGGYLCASRPVIDLIRTRARTLIYSTGLPPASAAAAIAALDVIENDPERVARPLVKARLFTGVLGLPEAVSPIVPLVLGCPRATLSASALLEREGYLVSAIRPPTVPEGTSRLRFTFTAEHRDKDILRLADLVHNRILPRDTGPFGQRADAAPRVSQL